MPKKGRGPRTNAMRLLDAHKVDYDVFVFSTDIHSAVGVAESVGLNPGSVYKTLVIRRERGKPLLVMVAGDKHVDLKMLAAALGEKRLHMATHQEAESWTGLQVGGISALALLNKGFDIYLDYAARHLDRVTVSAGQRGVNLRLAVSDLLRVTGAEWVEAMGEEG